MECVLCKIQYVHKTETSFNTRLNNHRSDVPDRNSIPSCRHFAKIDITQCKCKYSMQNIFINPQRLLPTGANLYK